MKGQSSAEYLLLLAVGIAMLGVSIAALSAIKNVERQVYALEKARIVAGGIGSVANEVCALGDGNSRAYYLEKAVLECSGRTISVRVDGGNATSNVESCEVECDGAYEGEVRVWNSRGVVKIG